MIQLDPEFRDRGKYAIVEKANILQKNKDTLAQAHALVVSLLEELDEPFMEATMKRCEVLNRMKQWKDSLSVCGQVVRSKEHKDNYSWNGAAVGWAFFYQAQGYENTAQFALAREAYDNCIGAWQHLPIVTSANAVNATNTQRQLRTAHFNRGDIRCGGLCGGDFSFGMRKEFGECNGYPPEHISSSSCSLSSRDLLRVD